MSDGELMDILTTYDLTGSFRSTAELCGCSHNTVKKAVEDRAAGLPPATRRAKIIDDWREVLEGWVVRIQRQDPRRQSSSTVDRVGLHRYRPHHTASILGDQNPMETG